MRPTATPGDQTTVPGGMRTVNQFCAWGCLGRTKFYSEVRAGRIKVRKIGSKTVVLDEDAEDWRRSTSRRRGWS
jgi:hypothetical protein